MSTHLLPIGSSSGTMPKYRRVHPSGKTITSALLCEHNREIYLGTMFDYSIFQIQKINLITSELTFVMDIPKASIGNYYIGGMLVDDNYIYLTNSYNENSSYKKIYRIDLSTQVISSYTSPNNFQCYGKMVWYDNHTIAMSNKYGFMFFDTEKCSWTSKTQSSDYGNRCEMSCGKKLIMSHYYTTSTTSPVIYNFETEVFSKITLPSSAISISDYCNGKFYIAQSNYLHIYDEETGVIEKSITVPWTNPKTINYSDGVVFVTQTASTGFFIYDIEKSVYKKFILPWTVKGWGSENVLRPTSFRGYYFLLYLTLGIFDYTEETKYNIGYKYDNYSVIFNKSEKDRFVYDNNVIEFNDSHMTLNDATITKPVETIDEINHIKKVSVSKSEYNKLKSVYFKSSTSGGE